MKPKPTQAELRMLYWVLRDQERYEEADSLFGQGLLPDDTDHGEESIVKGDGNPSFPGGLGCAICPSLWATADSLQAHYRDFHGLKEEEA